MNIRKVLSTNHAAKTKKVLFFNACNLLKTDLQEQPGLNRVSRRQHNKANFTFISWSSK